MSRTAPAQKPGRSKQDVQTPADFIAAVKRRFGISEFDIDLAASPENAQAAMFYTKEINALKQPWRTKASGWGWLNPEFSNIAPWVEKSFTESRKAARVLMLVPAGVGANWWRDWVHGKAFVLLLNGRLTFVGHTQPYPKDCALLVYGPDVSAAYEVWTWRAQGKAVAA